MSEQCYELILSKEQLHAVSSALEIVSRLKIGQWGMAVETCKDKEGNYIYDWDVAQQIENIIKPIMGLERNQSWGVGRFEDADILWDIHQVLRHRLSWDYAIEKGYVENEQEHRNWSKMLGVTYDEPMKFSKQPLPLIKKIKK